MGSAEPLTSPEPLARSRRLPRFTLIAGGSEGPSNEEIVAALAEVAEAHAPDGGYGETAWNAETHTVFWVCADWTSNEAHEAAEAAFLDVEGVEAFEHEAEAALPKGDEWEVVYPPPAEPEAATEAVVASTAVEIPAAPRDDRRELLAGLMHSMSQVVESLVAAPAPEPQTIHVHVAAPPAPNLTVNVEPAATPNVEVNLPEQPAPQVNVTVEPAALHPTFEVPAPVSHVTVEAPLVTVQPAQVQVDVAAAPAPNVTVEAPRPGPIRVEVDPETGERIFVPE